MFYNLGVRSCDIIICHLTSFAIILLRKRPGESGITSVLWRILHECPCIIEFIKRVGKKRYKNICFCDVFHVHMSVNVIIFSICEAQFI